MVYKSLAGKGELITQPDRLLIQYILCELFLADIF